MDHQRLYNDVVEKWDHSIIDKLKEFIKIPNKSPHFDPKWKEHGYMDRAMSLVINWCKEQEIKGLNLELLELEGRTPLLYMEVVGQIENTVLLYGHVDKQPEMVGWDEGKGPWQPVVEDDKLYGRGAADDGYAVFAALTAIKALQNQNIPHGRCVIIIEASEESGSLDLVTYLNHLGERIGSPDLIVCLDSGCGNYDAMWSTTSLRGVLTGDLNIEIQREGMHSGTGSGIVPSWYHVLGKVLSRVENPETGKIEASELNVNIPQEHKEHAAHAAKLLEEGFLEDNFTFLDGVKPVSEDLSELLLNQAWRPTLSVVGIDGVPSIENAGNVTLPKASVKFSFRLPPTCDGADAESYLKKTFERNAPYGTKISFTHIDYGNGWVAPPLADWLRTASDEASEQFFGAKAGYMGEGGSIPFMGMLGKKFPKAQFLITGVLGPKSNAHGPNEFIHLPMAKKLTASVAAVISSHYKHFSNR